MLRAALAAALLFGLLVPLAAVLVGRRPPWRRLLRRRRPRR
ncbi:MAG TPA: hypothetical protein VK007_13340 [Acidimicrobiales bacterium]|nr:hypothetical protein [Acidimicrobiales bacterium]